MSKQSKMEEAVDGVSALPGWPRFEGQSRKRSPRPSPRFFHEFRTQPIVLPIWLWNLLVIGMLTVFGGALLYFALGLLDIVLIFWAT